jgi:hypothetical protein
MGVRLASYRYKVEPETVPDHLGFIIDDQRTGTPMVQSNGGPVDLYGYTSMAVAALHVQEVALKEQQARIAEQDARIAALEARIAAMDAARQ